MITVIAPLSEHSTIMATVSRQSAFWAVFALGLNTFVQPGEQYYGRVARLSPAICLLESTLTLLSIVYFYRRTRNCHESITLLVRSYRREDTNIIGEPPKSNEAWVVRFLVFACGALPQAIKLFGMKGVLISQAWGAAYLISFLIREALEKANQ